MKHSRAAQRPAPDPDLYTDETMAMVYVGDVYSLVVQEGSVPESVKPKSEDPKHDAPEEDDTLWPLIR